MAESRTRNVAVNIVVSLLAQALMLILNFILRTIFIKTLGIDYLGVNGLFSNVLSILSFAELGIGNAIIFSLYKPLADGDKERLCSLMQLYKKIYRIIFLAVMVLGLTMIPFLHFFIKGEPNINENLILIYLLYLLNTAISYLYIYKQSIIQADQKKYIVTTILTIANIVKFVCQIVILYFFNNFILFLIIQLLCTFGGNIYCSIIADKKYPYIKENPNPLSKEDSKKIFTDVKSMAAYKFGSIILNSTDNVIISAMVNITTVGLLSNYTMLTGACNTILSSITTSFTASIGNLNAVGTEEQKYSVFNKVLLITAWVYGMAAVGMVVVSKYFISIWLGPEFVMKPIVVLALLSEFYVAGMHTVESHYRTTMGFFVKGRFAPVLAAIINIGLSIALCFKWGAVGVLLATSIARVLVLSVVDSWIIYKDGFHRNPIIYFLKNGGYLFLFLIIGFFCSKIVSLIDCQGWVGVVLQIIVVILIYNIFMLLFFCRSSNFREIVSAGKFLLSRKK